MGVFEKGNKAAEKWSEEYAIWVFDEAFNNAIQNDDILCAQDAFFSVELRPTTAHYLIKKFPVLESFKKDIHEAVICRVNSGALKSKMNNAAAIWRMKQLGEKDQQYMQTDNTNKNLNKELTGEEKEHEIKELKKQLDEFSDY